MRTRKKVQALKRMTPKAASVCAELIFYRLGVVVVNHSRLIPVKGSRVGANASTWVETREIYSRPKWDGNFFI